MRDWNPQHYDKQGALRYCAPACGCDCTDQAFIRATKLAAATCKRLGTGWTPRVWENGGWHFSVSKGKLEIHRNSARRWWANYLSDVTQFCQDVTSPEAAVSYALKVGEQAISTIHRETSEIKE